MTFTHVRPESSFLTDLTHVHPHNFLIVRIGNHKYGYFGVSRQRFTAFKRSPSKGQYYNRHIRGKFDMVYLHERKV